MYDDLINEEEVFGSLPEEHNPQGGVIYNYDANREKVLLYLMERKGQVRNAYRIAERCGLPTDGTQVAVRKYVKEINCIFSQNKTKAAIVSSNKGFMYTEDPADVSKNIDNLLNRIKGISRSIRHEKAILERMIA